MIVYLRVETPDDEDLHYPRVAKALAEYACKVKENNEAGFGSRDSDLGCTVAEDGTNSFVASNGVVVTEAYDTLHFKERTTMITMTPCSSSQIHAYAYDDYAKTLYLQFKRTAEGKRVGGSIYSYANVTFDMFNDLCNAPSAGTWFGANLKPYDDEYPYTKLTDEQIADLLSSGTAPQSPPAAA